MQERELTEHEERALTRAHSRLSNPKSDVRDRELSFLALLSIRHPKSMELLESHLAEEQFGQVRESIAHAILNSGRELSENERRILARFGKAKANRVKRIES